MRSYQLIERKRLNVLFRTLFVQFVGFGASAFYIPKTGLLKSKKGGRNGMV